MNKLLRNSAVIASGAIVAAILAPVLARGVAPLPSAGFAPNDACIGDARLLVGAVRAYAQDYASKLPPTDTIAHFQAAVSPYLVDKAAFTCPATHLAYQPNPAIGGHALSDFNSLETVILFQDAQPHADRQSTIAFLDGHIERGGVAIGNPHLICASQVKQISLAIQQYVQDNDEQYPLMDTPGHVREALLPYIQDANLFVCPSTGKPYEFNASLSHVSLASIANPATTIVVQDLVVHADGVRTIGYADGHVTPATMRPPPVISTFNDQQNLRVLGVAILQYMQDSDEHFPPFWTEPVFEAAVKPYASNPANFVNPLTGDHYDLNTALSGTSVQSVASPSELWMAKDHSVNPDGTLNVLYVDGHVRSYGVAIPQHISVGADNETRLVWSYVDGNAGIMRIATTGAELGRRDLGTGLGTALGLATTPSGTTHILFAPPNTGPRNTASLVIYNSGYVQTRSVNFGPYYGWQPTSVAVGANGLPRLLWSRADKSWAIWQASAVGDYQSDVRFGPFTDINSASLAVGSDNALSALWTRPTGEAVVWRLSPSGVPQSYRTIPAFRNRHPVAITAAPDNTTWVLLDRADGGATVYAFDTQLAVVDRLEFNSDPGWQARDLGVGADGNVRILWSNIDGPSRLRIVTPAGTLVSSHDYAAF